MTRTLKLNQKLAYHISKATCPRSCLQKMLFCCMLLKYGNKNGLSFFKKKRGSCWFSLFLGRFPIYFLVDSIFEWKLNFNSPVTTMIKHFNDNML